MRKLPELSPAEAVLYCKRMMLRTVRGVQRDRFFLRNVLRAPDVTSQELADGLRNVRHFDPVATYGLWVLEHLPEDEAECLAAMKEHFATIDFLVGPE